MTNLKLAIATTDYDHFRDFQLGLVRAEGIDHTWLTLGHHEIFARFTFNREWEAGELSFAKAVAQLTRENSDIIGLPVVCSRLFLVLREQEKQDQNRSGFEEQDHRFAGMGAYRGGLYARLAQRRARCRPQERALVSGRCQRSGPDREGRIEYPGRRDAHPLLIGVALKFS